MGYDVGTWGLELWKGHDVGSETKGVGSICVSNIVM